jgi:phenylacetate-CoA ligase
MTVRGLRPDRFIRAATSGSSGEPLTLFWDADRSLSFENAFLWHYYSWHGITPTSRAVQLRGYVAPNGSLFTYVRCNTLVVSCEAYGKDTIANVVDAIIAFQPDVIFAFPSTLLLIGKHILDHRLVGWLNPKVIVTSSERLYAEQEELATRSFRCPIMDLYGNTELTVHAIRCPSGGMHFNPFYGYVEIVGAAGGEIVSTGFSNFAMPFLRYRTGDYAEMSGRTCDCGRHWPCIDRLLGRDGDYLVRDDGTEVAVTILWALHIDMGPNMREFQVSQEKPGLVEFRYVADRELDPDTKRKLMATLSALRGLTFTLRRVPAIPRGPRGKYRMVDQRLNTTRRRLLAETDDA